MDITVDHFYKKKVTLLQQKQGYRFSVDSPILADFLPCSQKDRALEIGSGCGIISILALYRKKFRHITGLEIQKDLCSLSETNARQNRFDESFTAINADFNEVYRDFSGIKWIFSNPPFLKPEQGRVSASQEIKIAKFEIALSLENLLEKSHGILDSRGQLCLILPFSRFDESMKLASDTGFHVSRIRRVFSFNHGNPERFLIQLSKRRVSVNRMDPLIIFREAGQYSEDMEKILAGQ